MLSVTAFNVPHFTTAPTTGKLFSSKTPPFTDAVTVAASPGIIVVLEDGPPVTPVNSFWQELINRKIVEKNSKENKAEKVFLKMDGI